MGAIFERFQNSPSSQVSEPINSEPPFSLAIMLETFLRMQTLDSKLYIELSTLFKKSSRIYCAVNIVFLSNNQK